MKELILSEEDWWDEIESNKEVPDNLKYILTGLMACYWNNFRNPIITKEKFNKLTGVIDTIIINEKVFGIELQGENGDYGLALKYRKILSLIKKGRESWKKVLLLLVKVSQKKEL